MISAQVLPPTSHYQRPASRCPYLNGGIQDTTVSGAQEDPGLYSLRPLASTGQSARGEALSETGFKVGIESAMTCANSGALSGTVGACPKMSS